MIAENSNENQFTAPLDLPPQDTETKVEVGPDSIIGQNGSSTPESEAIPEGADNYREVFVKDLKLADLNRLDEAGQEFVQAILESQVVSNTFPRMTEEILTEQFQLVVSKLKEAFPGAKIAEILNLGPQAVKDKISRLISTPDNAESRAIVLSEGAQAEFKKALGILRANLERYAQENGHLLDPPNLFEKTRSWINKNFAGDAGLQAEKHRQKFRAELKEQKEFLENLESYGALTRALLDAEVFYIDDKDGTLHPQGTLSSALQFGTGGLNYLQDYIENLRAVPLNEVLPKAIYSTLEYIIGGYGTEPFTEAQSKHQFITGVPFAPRTGKTGTYLEENFFETVKVKKE
jgi:hypothetical protein